MYSSHPKFRNLSKSPEFEQKFESRNLSKSPETGPEMKSQTSLKIFGPRPVRSGNFPDRSDAQVCLGAPSPAAVLESQPKLQNPGFAPRMKWSQRSGKRQEAQTET